MEPTKIMIVEDEVIIARDIEKSLTNMKYIVLPLVTTGEEAVEKAKEKKPDLILMDIVLTGEIDGVDAAETIKNELNIPIIFLTSYSDEHHLSRAKLTEPFGYLLKPFEIKMLHACIQMALYKHKTEIKISKMNQFLNNIMETMVDILIVINHEKNITHLNQAALSILGYKKQELIGKNFTELICKDNENTYLNKCIDFFDNLKKIDKINDYELMFQNIKGDKIPVSISTSKSFDKKNNVCCYVCVARDIREMKETFAQLIQTEKLSVIGEYAAGIFHDIKNPLQMINMICGMIEMDMVDNLINTTKLKNNINDILFNVEKTNKIINHMNVFTGLSLENIQLININDIIDSGIKYFATKIYSKKIQIEIDIDESIPLIKANPIKIEQILLNLLSNAVNAFANNNIQEKKIIIKTYMQSKSDENLYIVLSVGDNAGGIPEKIKSKIFKRFFTTNINGNGVGLGLAIVKRIADEMNASIELDNKDGLGATFNIIFRIE